MTEVKLGIYRPFKGKLYEVIAVARDCEDHDKEFVVYKQLEDTEFKRGQVWIRSLEDFLGTKEVNGEKVSRFKYVNRTLEKKE